MAILGTVQKNDICFMEFNLPKYVESLTNTHIIRSRIFNSRVYFKKIIRKKTEDLHIEIFM